MSKFWLLVVASLFALAFLGSLRPALSRAAASSLQRPAEAEAAGGQRAWANGNARRLRRGPVGDRARAPDRPPAKGAAPPLHRGGEVRHTHKNGGRQSNGRLAPPLFVVRVVYFILTLKKRGGT